MPKSPAKGWVIQSLAEFIGTAMFMYLGVGGADAVANDIGEDNGYLAKAFAFGIGLAITAWGFFRISGSHFNPAGVFQFDYRILDGAQFFARGFFLESFLTMILCFVYHMVVHEKNPSTFMSAFLYGLTLFSCHLFATRYTNTAINPARAFATSVVARGFTRDHWIFWLWYVLEQDPVLRAQAAAAHHLGQGDQQTTYVNRNPNGTTTTTMASNGR
ncbi:hypothetical protein BGW39_006464 [Mortierella sp. 14UC]|nr:hypothetical protein BGW39_006464 [Mortierella sp. 14UC]